MVHAAIFYKMEALVEQNGQCAYCHIPLPIRKATADHRWPKSKRGSYSKENIAAACLPCNNAKGDMSHIEFYKLIDRKIPKGTSLEILMIWSARRIWKRAHRACERILKVCR